MLQSTLRSVELSAIGGKAVFHPTLVQEGKETVSGQFRPAIRRVA